MTLFTENVRIRFDIGNTSWTGASVHLIVLNVDCMDRMVLDPLIDVDVDGTGWSGKSR